MHRTRNARKVKNVIARSKVTLSLRGAKRRGNLIKKVEIATLPLVARNDNLLYEIAHPVPSKTKESSTLLAMTEEIAMTEKKGGMKNARI